MFQDIDSEKPIMQVGQYWFAGEYEGSNQILRLKHKSTRVACCLWVLLKYHTTLPTLKHRWWQNDPKFAFL